MSTKFTRECLSKHDQDVLDSVFNPLQIGGDIKTIFDADIVDDVQDLTEETNLDSMESIKYELEGVKETEQGNLTKAIDLFQKSIEIAPNRPSLYNNKAQALRLMGKDDDAFDALNQAIELSSKNQNSLRTKCQALCQRGILFRKREDLDAARLDFEEAAKLGSKFARSQLIEINPYAALCNQMLRDVFQKLT